MSHVHVPSNLMTFMIIRSVKASTVMPGFMIQFQDVTNFTQLTTEAYAEYIGKVTGVTHLFQFTI